ncbi:multiple inositol polyphosphate phosphatase 1-like [Pectinophora gossypiella]|uniref:multiple inositol polyphosphate phosphatase 1-like n=1 Tax=Pectinophora gossypiella TaxID=13191 RepID=UPI00214E713B|nr:multiple inositol polyphosphate phosphatase 1-like [Pectinophora gossypiella]
MKDMLRYILVLLFTVEINSSSFCYWNSGCPYKCFSSKTPYDSVRGDIRDSTIKIKGCEPISIWGLIRHGKRQPGSDFAKLMKDTLKIRDDVVASYDDGRSSLCAQDVENLKDWPVDNKLFNEPHQLTAEGLDDMRNLGRRLQQAFLKLLGKLEKNSYLIQSSTLGAWVTDSAKAFIQGFDDKNMSYERPKIDFSVAAPFATCEAYLSDVKNNSDTYKEVKKYYSNPEYLATKDRIQRRSGLSYALTQSNITALYDLCRYTSSGYDNQLSPWCALFTTEDLGIVEYIGDLIHYMRNSYGTPMAEKFGQMPLQDLLQNFKLAKEGKGKKLVTYITHSTMLDMVYTTLGLFKDESPLDGSHRDTNRKFRSCKMSTFSANFIAVLSRCLKNNMDEYNVVFYMNEEPMRSICKEGICSWKEFEEKLTFENVNLDFCR